MVYVAYFTESNLQICNFAQKRRICCENCKNALDENFHGHFCPRRKAAKFCHPGPPTADFGSNWSSQPARKFQHIQHTTNTHNSCFDPLITLSFQELLNSYVSLPSCLVSSASSAINIFGPSTMVAVSSISKTGHHPDIFDHTITLQEQYFAKFIIELACNNLQKIDPDW